MADNNEMDEPTLLDEGSGLAPKGSTFVLGMTWKVMLGADLASMAVQSALKAKANYYSHGANARSVGFTKIKPNSKTVFLSAASIVAAQNAVGDVLVCLGVNENETWLCGVSNGTVVTGYDVVLDGDEALFEVISDFNQRFPNAQKIGDVENGFKPEYSWQELTDCVSIQALKSDATLRLTAKPFSERLSVVPKKFIYLAVGLAVIVFGQRYAVPVATKLFFKPKAVVVIEPAEAWQNAIDTWVQAQSLSSEDSLNSLLSNLADQPLLIAGWRQSAVDCVWGQKAWACKASYFASNRSQTNQAFVDAKPSNWKVSFALLKDIVVTFDVPTTPKKLELKSLQPVSSFELVMASKIQEVGPLIPSTASPISKFTDAPVVEPKTEDGVAIALPSEMSLPKIGLVAVVGPLRNIAGYQAWVDGVAWTNVNLKNDIAKAPMANSSSVTMEIKGKIYAKK